MKIYLISVTYLWSFVDRTKKTLYKILQWLINSVHTQTFIEVVLLWKKNEDYQSNQNFGNKKRYSCCLFWMLI